MGIDKLIFYPICLLFLGFIIGVLLSTIISVWTIMFAIVTVLLTIVQGIFDYSKFKRDN
jgi:hypothetical protein